METNKIAGKKKRQYKVRERMRIASNYKRIPRKSKIDGHYVVQPTLSQQVQAFRAQLLRNNSVPNIPQRQPHEPSPVRSPPISPTSALTVPTHTRLPESPPILLPKSHHPSYIRLPDSPPVSPLLLKPRDHVIPPVSKRRQPIYVGNTPCKNHYGKGSDACSEMMPYCCPYDTPGHGTCRADETQCSKVGKINEAKIITQSNIPRDSIRKPESILSDDQKEYSRNKKTADAVKQRQAMLKNVSRNAPGCGQKTLQYLGPFGIDNVKLFYEHELLVDPKYLRDIKIQTLCAVLNKAIRSYDLSEKHISLHEFLKRNIVDYLFRQIERDYIDEEKDRMMDMRDDNML